MEIIADRLDWTSVDEENLSKFLDTETGKRFIPKLLETAPSLLEDGDTNRILIRNGKVCGYQDLVRNILTLAHPVAPPKTETASVYPRLEDDSQWDGEKLNPETKKD